MNIKLARSACIIWMLSAIMWMIGSGVDLYRHHYFGSISRSLLSLLCLWAAWWFFRKTETEL